MRESIIPDDFMSSELPNNLSFSGNVNNIAPFFSMRKLRLIYNELVESDAFEFESFDAFKHQVLNSVAPQLELNKWQAIAARR